MTFRHLKIFVTVADCKTMTEASKQLFIAQPTVSQAIAELEKYYNIKLFERFSKKLYLTSEGSKLLSYARHIIALFNEMELSLKAPGESELLRVGASVTIGAELLPKIVNRFTEMCMDIKVNATIKNTTEIENLIIKNDIDFALVEGIVHNSNIVNRPFMDDELTFVCGRNHPLYYSESVTLEELAKYDFVIREEGSGTRELFESVMTSNNMNWKLCWECNGSDSIISASINGIGIGVISKRLVKNELEEGNLKSINVIGADLKRKFGIIYHKNKFLTENMKLFFDLCLNI
ncbi:MAG: LysR family transcriptional regulator [Solirubrobacterales bacterium]